MRRVIENSGWSLAATAVSAAALFGETVILARALSPADFGVLLLIIAFPEVIQKLLDFRVAEAMTKYLGGFLAQGRKDDAVAVIKLLWLIEVAVTALALVIVLATAGIASRLIVDRPDLAYLMVIYAGGLFFAAFDSASGTILRVLDRFALSFVLGSVGALARLAAVIIAVAADAGIEGIVVARVAAEAIRTVVMAGGAARALVPVAWDHRHAPIRLLRQQRREIGFFLFNTNLMGVLRAAATRLDTVVVGILGTPAMVGVYKVSIQLGLIPVLLADALYVAVYPSFARAYATEGRDEIRQIARRTSILLAVAVLPAVGLFAVVGDSIVEVVFGEDYREAGLAATLCLIGVAPWVIFFWAQPLMLAAGRAGPLLRRVTLSTAAQFVLLVSLVPLVGAAGATVALGAAYILMIVLDLVFIHRHRLLAADSSVRAPDTEAVGSGPPSHLRAEDRL